MKTMHMRMMVNGWVFLALLVLTGKVYAQQAALADNHIFNSYWVNPGNVATDQLTRISLMHQHRHLGAIGWNSNSQFLDFRSPALGRKRVFGFGMNVANDIEHTERRLAVNFSLGAKFIQTEYFHAGVGINLGLINWASKYDDVPVYHQNDPRLLSKTNFSDLDAGLGLNFGMQTYVIRASADIWGRQIPGSFLSTRPREGAVLAPHFYGSGKFLYNIGPDVFLGPVLMYHNVISSNPNIGGQRTAWLDMGAKIELDRPRMWGGIAYRLGNGAMTLNYGINVIGKDTVDTRKQMATFMDLVTSVNYPLNQKANFGPNVEIGVAILFGMVGSNENEIDSLDKIKGAFWANNGNMDTHKERYLKATAPPSLKAQTTIDMEENKVFLDYEWDDVHYFYGDSIQTHHAADTMIAFLGEDWIGMDAIVENLVHAVISEALHPVNKDYDNIDSVEALKDFIAVDLAARLKFDQIAADFGAEGLRYRGELGYTSMQPGDTSISIRVLYETRDTVIRIPKGKQITNLELCALKLNAIERKLAYELDKYYGSMFAFVTDVNEIFNLEGKKIVLLSYPEIIPNNPNQEPFQVTMATLAFTRDPDWKPKITKKKDKKKDNTDKVTHRRQRDDYRDPVIGDEE